MINTRNELRLKWRCLTSILSFPVKFCDLQVVILYLEIIDDVPSSEEKNRLDHWPSVTSKRDLGSLPKLIEAIRVERFTRSSLDQTFIELFRQRQILEKCSTEVTYNSPIFEDLVDKC